MPKTNGNKKRAETKGPIVTYRFVKSQGGKVIVKGLHPDNEKARTALHRVLEAHGFIANHEEIDTWTDELAAAATSTDLFGLAAQVPISLSTELSARGKVICIAQFDKCESTRARKFETALTKAHEIWNKADRPVNGVTLIKDMDAVVKTINAGRAL